MKKLSKAQKLLRKVSRDVMQLAWKMAYKAAKETGYRASEFIVEAMKLAWRSVYAKQSTLF